MATSCFEGLNQLVHRLIAGAKIDHIVILDCSPKVIAFWDFVQKTLPTSSSNWEFLNAVEEWWDEHITKHPKDAGKTSALSPLSCLALEVKDKISWIVKKENFTAVQWFFQLRRVRVLQADMNSPSDMEAVAKQVHSLGRVDLLYLSNIMEYIPLDKRASFLENVGLIMDADSLIVTTAPRRTRTEKLQQVVVMPKERAASSLDPRAHLYLC